MISYPINLLLADDDNDDCMLFKEALEELPLPTVLTTVGDGEQLMQLLAVDTKLPSILFLDLNMPRKNGLECLHEIRLNEKYKSLPVIIYSTSSDTDMVKHLYHQGAHYYIRKPAEFSKLKKVISDAIELTIQDSLMQPTMEHFIIQP
ncbi:MAG: response regulator [Ferruginibacter sp.]